MTEFEYTYNYFDLMNQDINVTITLTKLDNYTPRNCWEMKQRIICDNYSENKCYIISNDEAKKLYQFANESNGKKVAFQSANFHNVKLNYSK